MKGAIVIALVLLGGMALLIGNASITGMVVVDESHTLTPYPQKLFLKQHESVMLVDGENTYKLHVRQVAKDRKTAFITFQESVESEKHYLRIDKLSRLYKEQSVELSNGKEFHVKFGQIKNRVAEMTVWVR